MTWQDSTWRDWISTLSRLEIVCPTEWIMALCHVVPEGRKSDGSYGSHHEDPRELIQIECRVLNLITNAA
ncbi:hypothetical protein L5515_000808 [Caenorhabditis briggsae]|uniref:Uncharacterized protein n=1 Tax=Caenorhabditis briggsae TaxID=6238 RepID=A0AAE9E0Y0_CAEBR|nr:hypothetical protein L3Y34_014733 [Caenorhabditis briggsae]UMM11609.1 hypothetical protein L5515_000808 [Caenorhabditis briggsae]